MTRKRFPQETRFVAAEKIQQRFYEKMTAILFVSNDKERVEEMKLKNMRASRKLDTARENTKTFKCDGWFQTKKTVWEENKQLLNIHKGIFWLAK